MAALPFSKPLAAGGSSKETTFTSKRAAKREREGGHIRGDESKLRDAYRRALTVQPEERSADWLLVLHSHMHVVSTIRRDPRSSFGRLVRGSRDSKPCRRHQTGGKQPRGLLFNVDAVFGGKQ